MSKTAHLVLSILFGILAVLNLGTLLGTLTAFSAVNLLLGLYMGYRSYEEFKLYNEK